MAEDINIVIVEEDSAVPKVATKVATSVIQIGNSCKGYREERVI